MFCILKKPKTIFLVMLLLAGFSFAKAPLVLMTDFGLKDGAVCAMRGVIFGVDPTLTVTDLTHEIPDYDIWVGAYRLYQTVNFWPEGTVFVSVVDPGVGTKRKSVVMKTNNGHFFVNPDNGLLTLIAQRDGVAEVREIDEKVNRLKGSDASYTFYGRDVYAYTGARLASGKISFVQVGPKVATSSIVMIPFQKPELNGKIVKGMIPVLDVQYGNVWTNIPKDLFDQLGIKLGENVHLSIFYQSKLVDKTIFPYHNTFGEVPEGQPLIYMNSLLNVSAAINMGSFASIHKVQSGPSWTVEISKAE